MMDEMKIKTPFMRTIIATLIRKAAKKYGYDIVPTIHDLELKTIDSSDCNNTIIHASVTLKIKNDDLKKLINNM